MTLEARTVMAENGEHLSREVNMTNNQSPEDLLLRRNFPPCHCPRCGVEDIPESRIPSSRLLPSSPPPTVSTTPPPTAYRPSLHGEAVFDVRTGRWGVFMGWQHGKAYLRPLSGGIEWDTEPRWLSTVSPES
ncbi:hypothetical protein [Kitasatospora purpeofusca]|uniref:hypothetical protein n=1 Tax=Kitasatospora purpeofusca TaxID=67352 RepID=UPI0036D38AB2